MNRATTVLILSLTIIPLALLLVACDSGAPEETAVPVSPEAPAVTPEEDQLEATAVAPDEDEAAPESTNPGLTAVIVGDDSAGAGEPFTFDATQSDPGALDIIHYQWNMGDGTTLFGISAQHAYEEAGFYTVTLTVTDEEGNVDVTAQVVEIVELTGEPPPGPEEFTLVGTAWALDYPMRGTYLTLEFSEDSVSGSAGCNTYSAGYSTTVAEGEPADISVSALTITSGELCTPEIMYQEEGYLESIASARTLTVEGQKLTLETDSGTLIFSQVEATG